MCERARETWAKVSEKKASVLFQSHSHHQTKATVKTCPSNLTFNVVRRVRVREGCREREREKERKVEEKEKKIIERERRKEKKVIFNISIGLK